MKPCTCESIYSIELTLSNTHVYWASLLDVPFFLHHSRFNTLRVKVRQKVQVPCTRVKGDHKLTFTSETKGDLLGVQNTTVGVQICPWLTSRPGVEGVTIVSFGSCWPLGVKGDTSKVTFDPLRRGWPLQSRLEHLVELQRPKVVKQKHWNV